MHQNPQQLPRRSVGEWSVTSKKVYKKPFADVRVDATFTAPSGQQFEMPGFFDGTDASGIGTWRVRFSPNETGQWRFRIAAYPANPELVREGQFDVAPSDSRGFLKATPGKAFGFHFESGTPAFPLGDTIYNLFGYAHCGNEVLPFMKRRLEQGYNFMRVRVPVSYFHGPDNPNHWQTRSCFLWGGGEQRPVFDRFNLDYFRTVDRVVEEAQELGMNFEMILEAWGFDYPFNSRNHFTAEWEEFYFRYVLARYDAFSSVWFWTLFNEYEMYPQGHIFWNPTADRWAIRMARFVKNTAPHAHPVTVHNARREPPFAERFCADPEAIDALMWQGWQNWKHDFAQSLEGWNNSVVLSEYGYERDHDLPLTFPGFQTRTPRRTRLGAWHGAFHGMPVANGFECTWGPYMLLDKDQEGVAYLPLVRKFFEDIVGMDLRPANGLLNLGDQTFAVDEEPLCMADEAKKTVIVYLPNSCHVELNLPAGSNYTAQWYDTRTGALTAAQASGASLGFDSSAGVDEHEQPLDWVLLLKAQA